MQARAPAHPVEVEGMYTRGSSSLSNFRGLPTSRCHFCFWFAAPKVTRVGRTSVWLCVPRVVVGSPLEPSMRSGHSGHEPDRGRCSCLLCSRPTAVVTPCCFCLLPPSEAEGCTPCSWDKPSPPCR
ncbi:hypothetical protein HJG60_009135 [Phyllostomus discolor]|uniref:Uncharacterized protein n=1 Tax=Phyllostomus discolor TaxID=89673 RepID=A0A834DH97_9CHIR|nr:hypothetical protein HJG60_009135 [Phyllostomus discolor]